MNTLQIAPGSPWWIHLGAGLLLYGHIIGGTIGLASGGVALLARKGSRTHILAGTWFFFSMLAMASVGGIVSPFLQTLKGDPKLFDATGGLFTLYLVATGWMTVRRKPNTVGAFETAACAAALALAIGVASVGALALSRPSGSFGGFSGTGYMFAAGLIALAAAFDLKVILRGGIAGPDRLARHLWRLCLGLFIAAASFFLGQQRLMPPWMQGSPLLMIPPFAVMGSMAFWLVKLRFGKVFRKAANWLRRHPAASPGRRAAPAGEADGGSGALAG